MWIPGHSKITGNEYADQLANEARNQHPEITPIPAADALNMIIKQIRQYWDKRWFTTRDNKLREIKDITQRWQDRDNTTEQRVLTRLRIGHTRLTHTFLLTKDPPPNCEVCGTTTDVRHILLQCRQYEDKRNQYDLDRTSLKAVLSNNQEAENKIIKFLKDTELLNKL